MKIACMLLMVVLMGMAYSVESSRHKRFLFDNDKDEYEVAKEEFNKLAGDVDFDAAVQKLIPHIHSDMTVLACTAVCIASAASYLGAAAPLAGFVCAPLCDGALAKLEETAG